MSGIYIKDMEMPKDKAVAVVIHPDGTAYTAEMFAGVCTEYLSDCTAVPVPPHGRLIDVDEACRRFPVDADPRNGYMLYKLNNELPTIIPAEEGNK